MSERQTAFFDLKTQPESQKCQGIQVTSMVPPGVPLCGCISLVYLVSCLMDIF